MAYHPFRHLGLKIVSVVLAVLLWLTVAREPIVERGVRAPLQFQNVPAELAIVGDTIDAVDVRVRGGAGLVSRLEPAELAAVIDLASARPGQRLFHLSPDNVRAPFGVQVEQVQPSTVALAFERSVERSLPVVPIVEGAPAPGFVVGQVTADPAHVAVVGPESQLRYLTRATTESVSVADAKETIRERVNVGVGDPAVRVKDVRTAMVTVTIVPAPIERSFQGVRVKPRNLARAYRVDLLPDSVSVDLEGHRDLVVGLSPDAVYVFVDLAGLGPGRYNLPVRTEPPRDVGLRKIEPPAIQVRIR